jgi:hypothetical protein
MLFNSILTYTGWGPSKPDHQTRVAPKTLYLAVFFVQWFLINQSLFYQQEKQLFPL